MRYPLIFSCIDMPSFVFSCIILAYPILLPALLVQVCVCVLKHAIRLLRISERMRFMRHKGAEDETMDFLLNPSLRLHLMACVFYAARNPHRPFDSSSVDLCFLFETICSFSETDVTLTMLVTLGVSLLLYPPQPPFSSSFSSSTSFTSSIEHRLQLVFTHPFILSVLGPTPNKTQQTFRCRFIAALCIGIEKLIADTVNTVNSILNGNINILTESASNTLEVAAVDLMNLISCVPLIAESFGKYVLSNQNTTSLIFLVLVIIWIKLLLDIIHAENVVY